MKKVVITTLIILCVFAAQSQARPGDPFTQHGCGGRVVSKGDPADKVLQYCGQPTSIQRHQSGSQTTYTHDREEWLYNEGPRGGLIQMNFRDGILVSIVDKGVGY